VLTNVVNTIKEDIVKGRSSVVVSIRVSDSVYTVLKELADKKGISVSAFLKRKAETLVNTISGATHSVNSSGGADKSVNTITKTSRSVNSPVNTMKDVLTDREGRKYKVIGGVRYILHNDFT